MTDRLVTTVAFLFGVIATAAIFLVTGGGCS